MTPDAPVTLHRVVEVPAQRSTAEEMPPPNASTPVDEPVQEAIPVVGALTSVLVEALCRVAVRASADRAEASTADIVVGAGVGLFRLAASGAGLLSRATQPLTSVLLHPPGLPDRFTPAKQLQDLAALGRRESAEAERSGSEALRVLIPKLVNWVLDRVDLQSVVARIDLDQAVRSVDLDAIAARLDLAPILDRAPVNRAAAHVDVDAVADRLDLERVIKRIDVDAVVAAVDLDAVAARLDLDAVIDRVDIVALAREVVEELDLPEIIRSSTGAMTSDAVRGVRARSMHADDAVAAVSDRFLWRRRGSRRGSPEPAPDGDPHGNLDE